MIYITGLAQVLVGAAIIALGFSLGVSWLVFCFGSIVVGVLLLLLAPQFLIAPFSISFYFGGGVIRTGLENMKTE